MQGQEQNQEQGPENTENTILRGLLR